MKAIGKARPRTHVVRLEEDVWRAILARAKDSRQSVNAYVNNLCESHVRVNAA